MANDRVQSELVVRVSDESEEDDYTPVSRLEPLPVEVVAAASMRRPNNSTSTAQEASRQVKAAEGTVFGLTVYNNNVAAQWVQLHDRASTPADTTVPAVVFEVAAQSTRGVEFGSFGRRFANGIYICNSTTDVTKTLGAADCLFDVQYE